MSFSQVSYGRKKAAASPQRRPSFSTPRNNKILSSRPSASSYGGSFKPMPSDRHPDNRHNVSIPSTDFPGSFSVFRDNTGTPYSSCSSVASLASLSSHSTCSPNGMASDQPGFDRQDDLISEDFLEAFSSLCLNPGVSSPQQAASLSNISHFKSPSPFAVSSHYSSSSEDDDDDKMERKPAGLETRGHGVDFMLGDQVYVTEGQLDAIGSVTWKNDESVSVLFEIPVDKVSQATHAKPFVGAFPPRVPTFPPRQKVQQTGLSDVTRPSIYSKKVTTVSSNDETLAGPQRDSKDKSLGFKSMPPSPGLQQPTASPGTGISSATYDSMVQHEEDAIWMDNCPLSSPSESNNPVFVKQVTKAALSTRKGIDDGDDDDDDHKTERKPRALETRGHGIDFRLGDCVYVTEGQLDAIGSVTWKNDESVFVLFEIHVDKVSLATHVTASVGAFPPRVLTFPPRQKVQQTGSPTSTVQALGSLAASTTTQAKAAWSDSRPELPDLPVSANGVITEMRGQNKTTIISSDIEARETCGRVATPVIGPDSVAGPLAESLRANRMVIQPPKQKTKERTNFSTGETPAPNSTFKKNDNVWVTLMPNQQSHLATVQSVSVDDQGHEKYFVIYANFKKDVVLASQLVRVDESHGRGKRRRDSVRFYGS